jgi:virginiamycin B lyase
VRFSEVGEFPWYSKFSPNLIGKVIVRGTPFPIQDQVKVEPQKPAEPAIDVGAESKPTSITPTKVNSYIAEYSIDPKSSPVAITADEQGNIWFAQWNTTKIAVLYPNNSTLKEYKIPSNNSTLEIWSIVFDAKGSLWFTEFLENSIWRFSPNNASFQRYSIPTKDAGPIQLAIDGMGAIWFTEIQANKIAKISADKLAAGTSKGIEEYQIGPAYTGPAGLAIAKDGKIWITEAFSRRIARFDPITLSLKEFETNVPLASPLGIAIDQNEILWIADHGSNRIIKFDPSTNASKDYSTSQAVGFPASLPYWITIDKQSNIWFNEHSGGRIAKFSPSTETLVEYVVPNGARAGILHFTLDKSGNAWFSESSTGKIAMIDGSLKPWFEVAVGSGTVKSEGLTANITVTVSSTNPKDRELDFGIMSAASITGRAENILTFLQTKDKPRDGVLSESLLGIRPGPFLSDGKYGITISLRDVEIISSATFVFEFSRPEDKQIKGEELPVLNQLPNASIPNPKEELRSPQADPEPAKGFDPIWLMVPVILVVGAGLFFFIRSRNKNH